MKYTDLDVAGLLISKVPPSEHLPALLKVVGL